jgi:hypothetical protein
VTGSVTGSKRNAKFRYPEKRKDYQA